MFSVSGSLGIFLIGLVAGFYFARFFDANPKLSAPALVSLLALIGVGPTALVLVQGYLQLDLLDPYGVGLAVGVATNFVFRVGTKILRFMETWTVALTLPSEKQGPEIHHEVEPRGWRGLGPMQWRGLVRRNALVHALADTLSDVSSSKASAPQWYALTRTNDGSYLYGKYQIRLTSYEVREGPKHLAGWIPKADLFEWGKETLVIQPLTLPARIVSTKDEADQLALQMALQWISEHGGAD